MRIIKLDKIAQEEVELRIEIHVYRLQQQGWTMEIGDTVI